MHTTKPTLIYDGDCKFCQYCVDYLKLRTLDAVKYQAYQQGTLGRPKSECQKSIQLVISKEHYHQGAAAGLCALSYGSHNRGWWLYKNMPGFSWISEKTYLWVSRHRSLCYKAAKIICGDPWQVGRLTFLFWGSVVLAVLVLLFQRGI